MVTVWDTDPDSAESLDPESAITFQNEKLQRVDSSWNLEVYGNYL
jgi:hypothetical protein